MSEPLFDQLATDLRPVKRLTGAGRSAVVFVAGALSLAAALVVVLFGWRQARPLTPLEVAGALVSEVGFLGLALVTGAATARARVPGERAGLGLAFWMFAAVVAALVGLSLWQAGQGGPATLNLGEQIVGGLPCTWHALALALPSLAFGIWFLRRGAPVEPVRAGTCVAALAVAISALALPLTCADAEGWHLMISHWLLPLAVVTLVSAVSARWLLKW